MFKKVGDLEQRQSMFGCTSWVPSRTKLGRIEHGQAGYINALKNILSGKVTRITGKDWQLLVFS